MGLYGPHPRVSSETHGKILQSQKARFILMAPRKKVPENGALRESGKNLNKLLSSLKERQGDMAAHSKNRKPGGWDVLSKVREVLWKMQMREGTNMHQKNLSPHQRQ